MGAAVAFLDDIEGGDFGQDNLKQPSTLQVFETDAGVRREHDFVELDGNALATDYLDTVSHALQTHKGFLLNLEVQLGGETDAAHHAQGVIGKRHLGVEGRGNDAVLEVGNAVERVDELAETAAVQTDSHRINGEVAAILVVLERTVLDNGLSRVVAVALLAGTDELDFHLLTPDSRLLTPEFHLCRTEVLKDRKVCTMTELLLQRLGHLDAAAHDNDIDIVGGTLEENIAHIAPHDIAFHAQAVGYTAYLVEDVLV